MTSSVWAGRICVQSSESRFAPLPVAASEHDVCALAGQLQRGMVADATVRTGDKNSFAGQGRNVCCFPLLAHIVIGRSDLPVDANYFRCAVVTPTRLIFKAG